MKPLFHWTYFSQSSFCPNTSRRKRQFNVPTTTRGIWLEFKWIQGGLLWRKQIHTPHPAALWGDFRTVSPTNTGLGDKDQSQVGLSFGDLFQPLCFHDRNETKKRRRWKTQTFPWKRCRWAQVPVKSVLLFHQQAACLTTIPSVLSDSQNTTPCDLVKPCKVQDWHVTP